MANELRTYNGAVAFISGGASGIGAALGRALATRGAQVVLADRDLPEASATARQIGAAARAEGLDVRDAAAFDAAVGRALKHYGRLDYVFNNAGTGVGGEVKDYTLDDWRYIVDVNLMGVIHGVQAAYPRMIAQGFGHIVNTASMAGLLPSPFITSYTATKHAVVGLSQALRIEARAHHVRVSVVCPGAVRTPILVAGGKYGRPGKLEVPAARQLEMWERLRPMDPDVFAGKVLGHVARDEAIIVEPWWWRAVWWLGRLSPAAAEWLSYRSYVSTKAELEAHAAEPPAG
ncbi:MAG TPA: SDR family oxidoreductase [Polyangia bacterium]|jgi:NAD(P)-dependent dehydrogenase (short-subunit alcohol dehydrogenase family)